MARRRVHGRPGLRRDGRRQQRRRTDRRGGEAEHHGVAGDGFLVGQAVGARGGQHAERDRRAGQPRGAGVDDDADEHLVRVHRRQRVRRAVQEPEQPPVGEVVEARDRGELGVDALNDVGAEGRQGAPEPSHPPGGGQAAHCRARVEAAGEPAGRADLAEQLEVNGRLPVDADDGRRLRRGRRSGCAGQDDRLSHGPAQRRQPEVLLQPGQGRRERLRHRAGAEHGARRDAGQLDRDRPALQQPQAALRVDRPLHVLGAAVELRDAQRQRRETLGRDLARRGVVLRPAAVLHRAVEVELQPAARDLAADQRLRLPPHGGHDEPVGPPRDRVGAEEHPPEPGVEHRLHQHGERGGIAGTRRADGPGGDDLLHGGGERVPAAHTHHRGEPAGHRAAREVLDSGRRPDDEGVVAAPGECRPGGPHLGRAEHVRAGLQGVHSRGRQDEPGQHGQAVGGRAGQRRGLCPDEVGVLRVGPVESHDGASHRGTACCHHRPPSHARQYPGAVGRA
jgi:hypothetical protein